MLMFVEVLQRKCSCFVSHMTLIPSFIMYTSNRTSLPVKRHLCSVTLCLLCVRLYHHPTDTRNAGIENRTTRDGNAAIEK